MPVHRRARSRSYRHPLPLSFGSEGFSVWLPPADDPWTLANFGEAAGLALEALEMDVARELLVLLDERRTVTAIVIDPPGPVGVFVGWAQVPGLEVPFCQTISITIVDRVRVTPPTRADREGYQSLRRLHMLQGLQLLDVILVDGEHVQSLAIACDPDPIWFEPFDPLEPSD